MKFVDYKCNDCEKVSEYYISNDNLEQILCKFCGSSSMSRIFAPIKCNCKNSGSEHSSSSKSCSGGSCSSCSGCH